MMNLKTPEIKDALNQTDTEKFTYKFVKVLKMTQY